MFRLAAEAAVATNDARSYLLGAVAVRDRDQVVVRAANGPSMEQCGSAHAEARVLRKAGREPVLYVVRISRKTGFFTMARPCAGCLSLMRNHYVQRCYYTIDSNEYGVIVFNGDSIEEQTKPLKRLNNTKFFEPIRRKRERVPKVETDI